MDKEKADVTMGGGLGRARRQYRATQLRRYNGTAEVEHWGRRGEVNASNSVAQRAREGRGGFDASDTMAQRASEGGKFDASD
eukprot:358237-Chlamydomonas_euryale.AAC.12